MNKMAVMGLAAVIGTVFLTSAAAYAAPAKSSAKEVKKVKEVEVKKAPEKQENLDLEKTALEIINSYFGCSITEKNLKSREDISTDYNGKAITPYVILEFSDDNANYKAIVNLDGSIRHLNEINKKAATTMVSEDDPYFKEKRSYDLNKIKLPSLSKCKEMALDFISDNDIADVKKITYLGEITTDMLQSTIVYQYDKNTVILVDISSQYEKVTGFGYMDDIKSAKSMCSSGVYREGGKVG